MLKPRFLPRKAFAKVVPMLQPLPLTILEEFLMLALTPSSVGFGSVPRTVLDQATAAAVMMDLLSRHRIDCDLSKVFIADTKPTGDDILDLVLNVLTIDPVQTTRAITDEIRFLSEEGEALRERAMQRLAERGILDSEERKILWVFGSRRYNVVQDDEIRAVKRRVRDAVLGDEIPDPREIALVALADACGLLSQILSAHELTEAKPRIAQVVRMDILGCALAESTSEVEASIAMASGMR